MTNLKRNPAYRVKLKLSFSKIYKGEFIQEYNSWKIGQNHYPYEAFVVVNKWTKLDKPIITTDGNGKVRVVNGTARKRIAEHIKQRGADKMLAVELYGWMILEGLV